MVAIKVTSADDIIKAYLLSLGYPEETIERPAERIKEFIKKDLDNNADILAVLDAIVLKKAKSAFMFSKNIKNEQVLAMFKLAFILSDGAKYYIFDGDLDAKLMAKMEKNLYVSAPDCKFSEMHPQKIEHSSLKSFTKRLFSFFGGEK